MSAHLLQVSLLGSDPPQVRPSEQIRQSSDVDSCQLLGAARLGFLNMRTQQRDLVLGFLNMRTQLRLQNAGP